MIALSKQVECNNKLLEYTFKRGYFEYRIVTKSFIVGEVREETAIDGRIVECRLTISRVYYSQIGGWVGFQM
jgi:hypothetical protein